MLAIQPGRISAEPASCPGALPGSIEQLEQRLKDQDAIIAEQQELIDELSKLQDWPAPLLKL